MLNGSNARDAGGGAASECEEDPDAGGENVIFTGNPSGSCSVTPTSPATMVIA